MFTNQFTETKNRFRGATNYSKPLSYEEWLAVPKNLKSSVLFVQFFDQIILAWDKAKSDFTSDEDGVSTVLQYLEKNVPLLIADKNRFTPSYIYKIAYNSMGCLRRLKRDKDAYEKTTSQYVMVGDDELNRFETIEDKFDVSDEIHNKKFWSLIENMDEGTLSVVDSLLNGNKCNSKKQIAIIENLKNVFRRSGFAYSA